VGNTNQEIMLRAASSVENFVLAGTIQLGVEIVNANNLGMDGAPPAPIDTGNLRGSLEISVGVPNADEGISNPRQHGGPFPLTTEADVRRAVQLGGFQIGDTLWERWTAPYANIIEKGRTVDKNGRPIGSEQAPDGWVHLGIDVAVARMAHWRYLQNAA